MRIFSNDVMAFTQTQGLTHTTIKCTRGILWRGPPQILVCNNYTVISGMTVYHVQVPRCDVDARTSLYLPYAICTDLRLAQVEASIGVTSLCDRVLYPKMYGNGWQKQKIM